MHAVRNYCRRCVDRSHHRKCCIRTGCGRCRPTMDSRREEAAAERARLPAHDEMVLIPAGSFHGKRQEGRSERVFKPNCHRKPSILTPTEIDRFQVTRPSNFLKFILSHDLPPLIDWQYDGGNFQETMTSHPVMHVYWTDAEAYCKWAGRLPRKLNGKSCP